MKQKHRILAAALLVLCLCLSVSSGALAAAAEEITLWTTSLSYDLEVTEPVLEELPDGQGRFTARAACRASAVGSAIKIAVAFYNGEGRMLDCWIASHTLEEAGTVTVTGTMPDYEKVGVYFFESDTLTPIRPAVLRMLDGQVQVTAAQLDGLKAELEERLTALEAQVESVSASLWAGKSVVFVGDSITAGTGTDKTYCEYLEESMGFSSVTVMGVPGSCVSTTSDYGTGKSPLISRWESIPDADLIVIFIGTNDYDHETPLGTIEDSGDVSFCGALNEIVPSLLAAHPHSRIVFLTPLHRYGAGTSLLLGEPFTYDYLPNGRGHTLEDYVDALKSVCARWSVPVIDLFGESGIHPAVSAQKTAYMPDGIHPNAAGHEKIARFIQNSLERYGDPTSAVAEPPSEQPDLPDEVLLQYGNKFVTDQYGSEPTRASSVTNLWLTAGQTVTLLDTDLYQWALAGTSSETSANKTHGYYPESGWSSLPSYTIVTDGWYGITLKRADGSEFSFGDGTHSDNLFDYISIQ